VSAGRTVVYLVVAMAAARFGLGGDTSAAAKQEQATSGALGLPGGQLIVGAVGLGVIAVGVGQLWRSFTEGFRKSLDLAAMGENARLWALRVGRAGYAAKGAAVGIVGFLASPPLSRTTRTSRVAWTRP